MRCEKTEAIEYNRTYFVIGGELLDVVTDIGTLALSTHENAVLYRAESNHI